jgi:hypothetical protein
MTRNEVADHLLHGRALDLDALREIVRRLLHRTFVRLLAGEELGVDDDAVLEIVDTERRRLPKADRAWACSMTVFSSFRLIEMNALNDVAPSSADNRPCGRRLLLRSACETAE